MKKGMSREKVVQVPRAQDSEIEEEIEEETNDEYEEEDSDVSTWSESEEDGEVEVDDAPNASSILNVKKAQINLKRRVEKEPKKPSIKKMKKGKQA
ncbi:MAG: hypothetical protein Q8O89_07715, partial [Nanoarchaeota archaeon]|nr:hypothetical protein [Nanoarchaeota archaeon]